MSGMEKNAELDLIPTGTILQSILHVNKSAIGDYYVIPTNTSDFGADVFMGSSSFVLFINVLLCLICVAGLAGNGLVTVTNIFILALAIADVAYLVQIPVLITTAVLNYWSFGGFYCRIYNVVTYVNQFASGFFLVIMSADRFIAICMPTQSNQIRTNKNAVIVCCLTWGLALFCMIPVALFSTIITDEETGQNLNCNINWPDVHDVAGGKVFAAYCFFLGYFLPVVLMLLFYGLVIRRLRERHGLRHRDRNSNSDKRGQNKIRRVSAVITLLILAFLCCWTPYWVNQIYIVFVLTNNATHPPEMNEYLKVVYTALAMQCLCYANSAVNPILYAMSSENFKKNFVTCHWPCPWQTKPPLPNQPEPGSRHVPCLQPLMKLHRRRSSAREIVGNNNVEMNRISHVNTGEDTSKSKEDPSIPLLSHA